MIFLCQEYFNLKGTQLAEYSCATPESWTKRVFPFVFLKIISKKAFWCHVITSVFHGVMSVSQVVSERRCPRWCTVDWEVWIKLAELRGAEKVSIMPAACHMLRPGQTWCWQGRGGRERAKSRVLNGVSLFNFKELEEGVVFVDENCNVRANSAAHTNSYSWMTA